jgi:non-specific serine/threonine protein kinase/serine/threonine-protein kinase
LRGDLDNIVMMALRKEPERRYVGPEQFAEDVRRHLQHLPVIARQDTLGYRASSFVKRHTLGVVAATVILAVLIASIVITTREARISEVQRERAERRFSEVRKLANSLIFDIHDSIRDLPGAAKSRHLVVDTSLHYLDSLSQEAAGHPGLERELATAYGRLGDIQGRVREANEGDYPGAQKSYRRSLALLEAALKQDPGNSDIQLDIVVTCGKLSDLLWNTGDNAGALEYSHLTLTHGAALAAAHVGEPRFQALLATAQLDYGYKLFHIRADAAQALHIMQPAVERLATLSDANPGNERFARTLALGYGRLAHVLAFDDQRIQEAWEISLQQQRVLDSLVAAEPANGDFAHLRAFAQIDLAKALLRLGRLEEATGHAQSALAAFRSLSASDPGIEEYHINIGLTLNVLAEIALRRGDPEGAIANLRESMEQTASVGANSSAEFRMVRADAASLLGDAQTTLAGDAHHSSLERRRAREEGCRQLQAALVIYRALDGTVAEAARQARDQANKLDAVCAASRAP